MARKKPSPPECLLVTEATAEGQADLVAELAHMDGPPRLPAPAPEPVTGELADLLGGMTPAEYTDAVYESLQDVLGEHDVYTVCWMLDRSVSEALAVMLDAEGPRAAQWAALGFAQSILPYIDPEPKTIAVPYKRLRKP